MKNVLLKKSLHAVYAVTTFLLGSVIVLWSWNTLSALFGGPGAQFKHAVAALAVAGILGWAVRTTGRRRRHPRQEDSNHVA